MFECETNGVSRDELAVQMLDASPNAYVLLDRELCVVEANREYYALTGSTPEALIGKPLLASFPNDPDDPNDAPRRMLLESLHQVIATGAPDHLAYLPYRVPRTPGEPPELRVWSATHTPILDASGATRFVLQHTQEIHAGARDPAVIERTRLVASALEDRARGLRSLFEQTPGFTAFLRGPTHIFELANPGYIQLVGGRDVVGRTVGEALPEVVPQGFVTLLDRVFETGEPFVGRNLRVELLDQRGEPYVVYLDFVYQPILGRDGGTPIGILVQGHDITEQRLALQRQTFITRATELLSTAADLDLALAEVAQAAVVELADYAHVDLFGEDGSSRRLPVAHASSANAEVASELAKYPLPGEIPNRHPFHLERGAVVVARSTPEMIEKAARTPAHAAVLRAAGFDSFVLVPLWHRGRLFGVFTAHTAGSGRTFDERIVPVMTELGRIAATALENLRLGREREALLASEHEARERAEAANRAKDEFIALLGHELRNPLSPILSAVELLRHRGAAVRETEVIERQTRHLVRLVDDLLDVSRIVHGKIELRHDRIVLSDAIAKGIEIANPQISAKSHALTIEMAPELAVIGDDVRLAQVIANLLTNAARYTPPHGRIAVSSEREGNDAVIRVRDNGIGITADVLPRIFDMFVQAPQPSDRATGGLGIGLTLVHRIVELHGGTVIAASEGSDRGTEITIRLPLAGAATASTVQDSPEGLAKARRVLVVDDNVDAAELLGELLATRGHQVEVVHDGEQALARLSAMAFDTAIVDIGLPRMDGYELARRIRAQLHGQVQRLVALTGYGSLEDRERSKAAGFDVHLSKPVDTATLLGMLETGATK